MARPPKALEPASELGYSDLRELGRLAELSREARLRSVLDFLGESLEPLTDVERTERLRRLFTILRPRRVTTPSGPVVWESETAPTAADASLHSLQRLQEQLRDGVRAFIRPGLAWALPAPTAATLSRPYGDRRPSRAELGGGDEARWTWVMTWPVMMVAGVADLVWEHAERVRACKVCNVLFLATKRQEYCTPEHGQRARDQRRATRKKGGPR